MVNNSQWKRGMIGECSWRDDGLHVPMPTYKPNDYAMVIKIEGLKLH